MEIPAGMENNMAKKPNPETPSVPPQHELEITVRGSAPAVRRALTEMRFAAGWDQGVARGIALDETGVPDADLDDEIGGQKIRLFSEETRLMYRDRCCQRAADLGHPVANPGAVASDADSTVMKVGDTLHANAR
jgi:hypothetical protein